MTTLPAYPPFRGALVEIQSYDAGTYTVRLKNNDQYANIPEQKVTPMGSLLRKMARCHGVDTSFGIVP